MERLLIMRKPEITGEWQLLFKPKKYGCYLNDHTLVCDKQGYWHLFGITSHTGGSENERYFVHGKGKTTGVTGLMDERGIIIDNGTRAWAPACIEHDGLYYLYYGPSPTKMDVSFELDHWMGYEIKMNGTPVLSTHRDHMIIRDTDRWIMYASGVKDGYSSVSCHISTDLLKWDFVGYALTSSDNAPLNPPWGAFESPFVVKHEELYYLFTTYTNCSKESYQNTLVFCSADPLSFGNYTGENHNEIVITTVKAHAPEIICEDGKYFITNCGWKGYDIPFPGGVAIAELKFE